MKIKVKEGHAGVMTLKDGNQMNYGVIRVTQNLSKVIFYTEKGLREMFKHDMTEKEKVKAGEKTESVESAFGQEIKNVRIDIED